MRTMLSLPFKVDNVDLRWIYILTLCKKMLHIFKKLFIDYPLEHHYFHDAFMCSVAPLSRLLCDIIY